MKKIELNREYFDGDEKYSKWVLMEKTENNIKLQLNEKYVDDDGEYDNINTIVIVNSKDIRAISENIIITTNAGNKKADNDNSENIKADKEEGFSTSEEMREYEIEIAKKYI